MDISELNLSAGFENLRENAHKAGPGALSSPQCNKDNDSLSLIVFPWSKENQKGPGQVENRQKPFVEGFK